MARRRLWDIVRLWRDIVRLWRDILWLGSWTLSAVGEEIDDTMPTLIEFGDTLENIIDVAEQKSIFVL